MTFLELAGKRYSCRNYDSRPVEREKLEKILEAGRIAPSAVNKQPWRFHVFTGKESLKEFYEVYHREWFRTAPCVIAICGDHRESWKRRDGKDHCDIDIAIATDHMTLQASELGLATCWICNFDPEKTRKALELPEHQEPMVLIPVGYPLDRPDPDRQRKKRKTLEEIVVYR
mgnify:FL=1